jgi:hypothetical protein
MKRQVSEWLWLLGSVMLVLLVFGNGTRLIGQQYFGLIVGTITDPSGAAVPDCRVTATNVNTGISRSTKTDGTGSYRLESLIPGTYSVKVEKTGFETSVVPSLQLTVAGSLNVNITLKLGSVTQTVEVQAVAPLLDTTSATVGTTISNSNVVEMPLNGRAYTDLLQMVPGSVGAGSTYIASAGQNYSISGNRWEQNNYTLDGVNNNEEFFKQFAIQPAIDSIQEFKVQTNISSAEFGQAAGANITVATKSGTNQLHGSAYEFLRNDALDAAQFFGDKNGVPKTPLRMNQFGVTGGGPIYIPHTYNGHDKAFWFFNYEGVRVRQASTQEGVIPTIAQLQGNLTDQSPIYDPATTTQVGTDSSGNPIYSRQQISCNGILNTICPDRLDSFGTAYAAVWYPQTTVLPSQTSSGYNSVVTAPYQLNEYQFNGRVDYKFTDNLQFFARFTDQHASSISPYALADNYNNLINSFVNTEASLTWLASPTTVVSLKSAFNRTNILPVDNYDRGWTSFLSSHPIQGTPVQSSTYPLFPMMLISGYTNPSQNGYVFLTNIWQELGSISMIRGKHSIKAGFEINHKNGWTDDFYTSEFDFNSPQTADPQNVANTGSPLGSFLLGLPSGGTRELGDTSDYMVQTTEAVYFQDDIKVKPKLTVNLGLRWEYDQWPTEAHGHLAAFDFTDDKFVWAGKNALTGQGPNINDPSLMRPDYRDFAPRVGVAYQLTPKSTLRAGYGIFYSSNYWSENTGGEGSWPYAIAQSLGGTDLPGSAIVYSEQYWPSYDTPVPGTPADAQYGMARHNRTPYAEQWNFGLQRQLANNLMLEVDYIGDAGKKMPIYTNRNDPEPGPGTVGLPGHFRPYQYADPLGGTYPTSGGLGAISSIEDSESSSYNGLQVKLEKKFSNGLQFLLSYAYSHYIDWGGAGFNVGDGAPQNDDNPGADRSDGLFDIRHNFTGNWVYDFPAGRGRHFLNDSNKILNGVLGGWEFTGIAHMNTGAPLGININFDNANIGQRELTARPDYVAGQAQMLKPASGTDQTVGYLNPNAFVVAAEYTYGNLGRNTARNLGMENFDLGLYKNFSIRENKERIQFRAEFFNAFNHVNLGGIDGTIEDPTFGSIGSTQNSSREIQFALKLYF